MFALSHSLGVFEGETVVSKSPRAMHNCPTGVRFWAGVVEEATVPVKVTSSVIQSRDSKYSGFLVERKSVLSNLSRISLTILHAESLELSNLWIFDPPTTNSFRYFIDNSSSRREPSASVIRSHFVVPRIRPVSGFSPQRVRNLSKCLDVDCDIIFRLREMSWRRITPASFISAS